MNIRLFFISLLALTLFLSASFSVAGNAGEKQEIPGDILDRVSRNLQIPDSEFKGKMLHVTADKKQSLISFTGISVNSESLYRFTIPARGLVLKALFKNSGKQVWVFNNAGLEIFCKNSHDRFDTILGTNFSYMDLAISGLVNFFSLSKSENAAYKGNDCFLIELLSGSAIPYGSFDIYVEKMNYIPLRIDIHDKNKIIFKSATIVKTLESGGRIIPVRLDMLDILKGSVTILEYTEFKAITKFNPEIFRRENLAKEL